MSDTLAIIPSFLAEPNDLEVTLTCIESLRATEPDLDLLVVDDGSPAGPLVDEIEAASSRLEFELHRKEENTGFSRTVNIGLHHAIETKRNAVLVNADLEFVDPGWLGVMEHQQREDGKGSAAVVGARLLYPSGLIQHAGVFFSDLHRCFDHIYKYAPADLPEAQVARTCPVTGALQFIRLDCLEAVGVYDEAFTMGWEDVDYCLRTFMAGGDCVYQPKIRAFHFESLFRGRPSPKVQDWQTRSWIAFLRKYAEVNFARYLPTNI